MINHLDLVEPDLRYESAFRDFLTDYEASGEKLVPFVLRFDCSDFPAYLERLNGFSRGIDVSEACGPHSTYWLLTEAREIAGAINIRHRLSEAFRHMGGHIGYGIAPRYRRLGYATEMLRLGLGRARLLGIDKALVTLYKTNIASAKVALNNGAIFDSEESIDGEWVQRYWVAVDRR